MNTADRVKEGLGQIAGLLGESALEPNPERVDWLAARAALDKVQSVLQTSVLGPLAAGGPATDELNGKAADITAAVGAVLVASGDSRGAAALFERAQRLAPSQRQKAGFAAALSEPKLFAYLAHAIWLDGRNRSNEARQRRQLVAAQTRQPALREAAGSPPVSPPDPARRVGKAPSLMTMRGWGFMMYGKRDRRDDGTFVSTRFFTAFFFPLVPLSAYRVMREGDAWWFQTREPLSSLVVWYRRAMLAVLVSLVLAGSWSAYQASPGRRVGRAVASARALENGDRDAAELAYHDAIRSFLGKVPAEELEPAALGVVRLALAEVKEPFTAAQLDAARRAVSAFDTLPSVLRTGPSRQLLVDTLVGWAKLDASAGPVEVQAALALLEDAERVGGRSDLGELRVGLRRRLAASYEPSEPMAALALYLQEPGDAASRAGAGKLLTGLSPSLLLEHEDGVSAWCARAGSSSQPIADALALARARRDDAARQALFEGGDVAALAKAVAAAPDDQELVVALAAEKLAGGDAAAARQLIDSLGPPNRLTGPARTFLARLRRDSGDLAGAEQLLAGWLAWRRPMFQSAASAYESARRQEGEQLEADLGAGKYDRELDPQLEALAKDDQQAHIEEWYEARMNANPRLVRLGGELGRYTDVVPAALLAGEIALERARAASGDEAQRLLALAEEHYVSIRSVAGGSIDYHLGLGQVYYRLGRPDDGEDEFEALLEDAEPGLRLAVASVYRELGITDEARQLVEEVANDTSASEAERGRAATLAAMLSLSLEERLTWLRRAGTPEAKNLLLQEDADELATAGKPREADAKLAEAQKLYQAGASHNSADANNAALVAQRRYEIGGQVARLDEALKLFELSVRLDPSSAIATVNLANATLLRGRLRVLAGLMQIPLLRLDANSAESVCDELADGPGGDQMRAALRQDPGVRRALELFRRAQLLSPQDASFYVAESSLLGELDDEAGRLALAARVSKLSTFHTSDAIEGERRRALGLLDTSIRKSLREAVTRSERLLAELPASATPATRAVAELLVSRAHSVLAYLDGAGELVIALQHADKALAAWPQRFGSHTVSWLGASRVVLEVATANPERAEQYNDLRRMYGPWTGAFQLMVDDPSFVSELRARPELRALVARIVENPRPGLSSWIVARLLGDAALEKRIEAGLTRPLVKARYDIVAVVRHGVPSDDREVALYRERK